MATIDSLPVVDRRRVRRVLAVAGLASLAVHVALLVLPLRLPDRVEEPPPLLATITALPPPPAPVEVKPTPKPKPGHRHVARVHRPPVAAVAPAPEIVAAATPAPEIVTAATPAREIVAAATPAPEPAAASVPEPAPAPPPLEEPIPATPSLKPPHELPPRIDLAYHAFLGTRGFVIGDAVYRLEHSGSQYTISTVGEARGLAALLFPGQARARSEGAITADGLQPSSYSIERTARKRHESADFDWETGMVQLNGEVSAPLELPTFDPLVVLWQFYFSPPVGDEAEFNVATTRKVYHYTFRRIGREKVRLPFGELDTDVWKKVAGDGKVDGQVWLAPSLRYVAVKVRLSNGLLTVEGLLDSIRVGDTVAQQ